MPENRHDDYMWCHLITCDDMWYHVMTCDDMWWHVMSCYDMPQSSPVFHLPNQSRQRLSWVRNPCNLCHNDNKLFAVLDSNSISSFWSPSLFPDLLSNSFFLISQPSSTYFSDGANKSWPKHVHVFFLYFSILISVFEIISLCMLTK